METRTAQTNATSVVIPEAHRDAATRYIAAIVRHDPLSMLGDDYTHERSSHLWDQFVAGYASLATGPYARHGADVIRIALGRL